MARFHAPVSPTAVRGYGTDRRVRPPATRGAAIGTYQQRFGPNQQQDMIEEALSDPQMGATGEMRVRRGINKNDDELHGR